MSIRYNEEMQNVKKSGEGPEKLPSSPISYGTKVPFLSFCKCHAQYRNILVFPFNLVFSGMRTY